VLQWNKGQLECLIKVDSLSHSGMSACGLSHNISSKYCNEYNFYILLVIIILLVLIVILVNCGRVGGIFEIPLLPLRG
jgi:hypothetical protein